MLARVRVFILIGRGFRILYAPAHTTERRRLRVPGNAGIVAEQYASLGQCPLDTGE